MSEPSDETQRIFMLDVGQDRVRSQNAISVEVSAMLPTVRFPWTQMKPAMKYVRVFAEPGVGFRAGCPQAGGYGSAKVMLALLSGGPRDLDVHSPFIEIQRRLPFTSPMRGDTRLMIGIMRAWRDYC